MRVVSLLPAATEMLGALGALEHLVGVTHECDHPDVVVSRARVTSSVVDVALAPGAVDRQVRETSGAGQPLFALREELIRALHPDVILTQALCDVCAVSETDVRALAAKLEPAPAIVTLGATTLDGVFDDLRAVAAAIGLEDEVRELVTGLRARLRHVHGVLGDAKAPRPRVAVIEWTDPLYAAGHWVPEMIHRAGGVDVLATSGAHSTTVTLDAVRAAAPEVIVVAPCGYDARRAREEAERLLADDRWSWARAIPVWAIDANGLVSRPGPRLVDGVETLAEIMHPGLFEAPEPDHAVRVN